MYLLTYILTSINLDEDAMKGPIYQFQKLPIGLRCLPCLFTELMNTILSELPDDIRSHVECIMDDFIIFTPNIEIHMKVIKAIFVKIKTAWFIIDPY